MDFLWGGQSRRLQNLLVSEGEDAEDQFPLSAGSGLRESTGSNLTQQRQLRKAATGSIIAAATLFAMVGLSTLQAATPSTRKASSEFQRKSEEGKSCHTAVKGETCHKDVQWAMTMGIRDHPEWYDESCPRLQPTGTFEEFQACVFRINKTSCPLPCNPTGGITKEQEKKMFHSPSPPDETAQRPSAPCHIVKQGACYDKVLEVMLGGYERNPDAFPGISKLSTFEEIQAKLHEDTNVCPRPCRCQTATEDNPAGKKCWGHVRWAMEDGVRMHPTWYESLTTASSFEEVQAYLHKDAKGTCQLPCSSVNWENAKEMVGSATAAQVSCNEVAWPDKVNDQVCGECKVLVDRMDKHYEICGRYCQEIGRRCVGAWREEGEGCNLGQTITCETKLDAPHGICQCGEMLPPEDLAKLVAQQPPPSDKEQSEDNCHPASEDSKCGEAVTYGMKKGLFENPRWYPDLDQFSSFEDFQKVLHHNKDLQCPVPCKCHTTKKGEKCYKNVKWVLQEGIEAHADWYPGLSGRSRWEEVQARLHEDQDSPCEKPCSPKVWDTPSLFCVAVFRSQGYELDLVRAQVEKGAGIFGCDEFATLSDKELDITEVVKTLLMPPPEEVGVSKDGTAANTLIFMQMWEVIRRDVRYKAHDWIIKADPDAVVLPDRIRNHLRPHTGKTTWITNCMKYEGPGWPMMFGSLEAFSVEAMELYFENSERCRSELEWQAWGEDLFMGNCLSLLGAESQFDGGLIGDKVCKGGDCADGVTAAYHPYKDADSWFECYDKAMGIS